MQHIPLSKGVSHEQLHSIEVALVCSGSVVARYRDPHDPTETEPRPMMLEPEGYSFLVDRKQSRAFPHGFLHAQVHLQLKNARSVTFSHNIGVVLRGLPNDIDQ